VAVPQIILAIIANQPPVLGRAIFWNDLGRQVMALFGGAGQTAVSPTKC